METNHLKIKKYEEVPFELVAGSENRNKRLKLLISGAKLPRNNKDDNNPPSGRKCGGRRGRKNSKL